MATITECPIKLPEKVPPLNTLDLSKSDWDALREEYGAVKGGAWKYEAFTQGAAPGFKLAAQIDLDRWHGGGTDWVIDWPVLFAEQADVKIAVEDAQTPEQVAQAIWLAKTQPALAKDPGPEQEAPQGATGSLVAMAQAITANAGRWVPTNAELRTIRGALGIAISETDGSPEEHAMVELINAQLGETAWSSEMGWHKP